ncbi:MAG: hypothetical protein K0S33_284 [Bacteroidetes bacterium]|jgi:hypothetical protein|nr:hypothetical protein [Bacteroidota bacterium]
MEQLRPNKPRALIAIAFIWISLAVELVNFYYDYCKYTLLQRVDRGELSITDVQAYEQDQQAYLFIHLLVLILSAVTFIQWFRRAYYNLHKTGISLSYSEGWAAGAWFVPILSLFRPYQIMKELYEGTETMLYVRNNDHIRQTSNRYINTWWTLWILVGVIGQFTPRYAAVTDSIDGLLICGLLDLLNSSLAIILCPLTVKVIYDYSKLETMLSRATGNNLTEINSSLN